MGSPRMNLIKARLAQGGSGLAFDIQAGARPLVHIDLPDMPSAMNAHIGSEVIAGIRAEAVNLARAGMVPSQTERAIDARVEVIEPTGADTLVVLDFGGNEFTVRLEPDVSLKPGQDARFFVDLAKLVCFDPKTERLIA